MNATQNQRLKFKNWNPMFQRSAMPRAKWAVLNHVVAMITVSVIYEAEPL